MSAAARASMYYDAVRRAGEVNIAFLELVKDGMTREELIKNIERRRSLWGRFEQWVPMLPSATFATHDKPLAAAGLTSYRCQGRYGWIMIGAKDHADAMREARRSCDCVTESGLQIWDGSQYVHAYPEKQAEFAEFLKRAIACSGK
jgi:hypothetical protein